MSIVPNATSPPPQPASSPTWAELLDSIPSPKSLVERLDRHVTGQRAAKRTLAVAVGNHLRRLVDSERWGGRVIGPDPMADAPDLAQVVVERSNVLLIGPSGSGKTLLVNALTEALNIPVVVGDATTFTEAGYVGADVESLLTRLLLAAGGDFGRAQAGIVFLDEIDKIARRPNTVRDISGEGVQQSLLKMIEGFTTHIPTQLGPRQPDTPIEPFDTAGVLFICGGAFPGLDGIIARRLGRNAGRFGFGPPDQGDAEGESDLPRHVLPCDLEEYGMIPELVGRLPVVATLDDLGEDDLARILTGPSSALIKQYRKLLWLRHGADLEFTPEAIREMAKLAHKRGVGARGLRAVVEQVVEGVMFEASEADRGHVFVIDERVVGGEAQAARRPIRALPPLRSPLERRRLSS